MRAVIGFDLDMTLVDSREAIVGALGHLCATLGVRHDHAELGSRIGLPLADVIEALIPGTDAVQAAEIYREHYTKVGLPSHELLPGAAAAVATVQSTGGKVAVITGKRVDQAELVLASVGLQPDWVIGSVFGVEKGSTLIDLRAHAYFGDHPADIKGARRAQVLAVGVATGDYTCLDLLTEGADFTMADLTEFDAWFQPWRRSLACRVAPGNDAAARPR